MLFLKEKPSDFIFQICLYYSRFSRETEPTGKEMGDTGEERERRNFKELAYTIVVPSKSKICRAR